MDPCPSRWKANGRYELGRDCCRPLPLGERLLGAFETNSLPMGGEEGGSEPTPCPIKVSVKKGEKKVRRRDLSGSGRWVKETSERDRPG